MLAGIVTRIVPATDTNGTRILATWMDKPSFGPLSFSVPYNYSGNPIDMHREAARGLVMAMVEAVSKVYGRTASEILIDGEGFTAEGYVFTLDQRLLPSV